ncbi:MAG: SDR family oxidoreductase [Pirellulales bacterium]|jgi:3-oxoacyl-[acyl-carrier protein] reductase|nr:SDR family oxidoreductase [Pirellulales bacterium]
MPVSLISGGSRGLGLATVQRLLERGDQVATFSRSGSPALTSLAEQFPDRLYTGCLDASKNDKLRQFVAQVTERFGGITHCVANAAIAHEGVLATMRDDQIEEMLAVNLAGSIMLVREAVRQMLLAPAENAPSVVVVSSVVAKTGSQGLSVYAATKAGLEGFAISLARELGPRGIRVNAVAPGFLDTDLSQSLSADNRQRIIRRTALGRLGTPDDIVSAIDYLTSSRASFLTGQIIAVDGGA